ncbi:MAG TPA: hypothetical protein DCQ46_06135, partial [Lachnospiraceae bacterium]|nr:hypothetical protein [Lachnospiraceae bacterium]
TDSTTTVEYSDDAAESTSDSDTEIFSKRDLKQSVDTSSATTITVAGGEDVTITEEGIYVITGTASEVTIYVEASEDAKVQLVLDGANITNSDSPAIYVKTADKVFVTTSSDSSLSVTGSFVADGSTKLDAVIFSKTDLTLNGTATLTINSTGNGITCKDDLKATGGTYNITASGHGLEAKDSLSVSDGTFTISAGKDGIHCVNSDNTSKGSFYSEGGTFNITSSSDGIQATTTILINGGSFTVTAEEGMEATNVTINDGTIIINASDDGINATDESTAYTIAFVMNGGSLTINMGNGDTDAIDSNGDLYINGGTVDITANSAFDFDGEGAITGGTVTVNGSTVTEITNQMIGGGKGKRR